MYRKIMSLSIAALLYGCVGSQQTPVVITDTPPAESPTPQVVVVTATRPMEVTLTTSITPRPTPTPRPQWRPVSIETIEEAFKTEGYSRNPVVDDEGEAYLVWVMDNRYERVRTWEDGTIVLEVLHDKSEEVRATHMERKLQVLDKVLPASFMGGFRAANDAFNHAIGPRVSGEPDYVKAYGGRWQRVNAEYNASESQIGGYRVRFSLWWRQATCPPEAWYCYYLDFPGLEFTGDSSLVFYTIRLTPLEDYEIAGVVDPFVLATAEPTPSNVGIGWEFNTNGDEEGWTITGGVRNLHATQGNLHLDAIDDTPTIQSRTIHIDAATFPIIELRMRLSSVKNVEDLADVSGAIFYITSSDNEWGGAKGQGFKVNPWGLYKTYTIDMRDSGPLWSGTIEQLWVVPLWGEAKIEIDYIRLLTSDSAQPTPTPTHGRQWTPRATVTPTGDS